MLRHEGFTVTTDTARALAEKLAEARRLAITALRTGMRLPDAPNGPPRAGDRPRGMSLADAVAAYLGELRRPGGAMTGKTVDQIEKSLLLVRGYVPDRATILEVPRATAGQFVADLQRLDPNYRRDPAAPALGLKQLVAKHPAGAAGGLAAATIQRHVSNIAGLWRWAEGRGLVAVNPWMRLSLPKGEVKGHLPYTPEELRRLAAALPHAPPDVALAFTIGLYSGLRLSEVASIDAIVLDGPVPYLDLTGSRRKTGAGKRRVPIHPALLPHLAGVAPLACDPKVLGKRFARWKARAGVDRERTDFHSLRKNAAEALERAGVAESDAALILGHATGRGFTFSVYSPHGPGMARLRAVVERIAYPGVDLSHTPVAQCRNRAA
jgi:integrase